MVTRGRGGPYKTGTAMKEGHNDEVEKGLVKEE